MGRLAASLAVAVERVVRSPQKQLLLLREEGENCRGVQREGAGARRSARYSISRWGFGFLATVVDTRNVGRAGLEMLPSH